jgi:histidyl-tRNA synthetase
MNRANRLGASQVALIGETELGAGTVTVKNMADGSQTSVGRDEVVAALRNGGAMGSGQGGTRD